MMMRMIIILRIKLIKSIIFNLKDFLNLDKRKINIKLKKN